MCWLYHFSTVTVADTWGYVWLFMKICYQIKSNQTNRLQIKFKSNLSKWIQSLDVFVVASRNCHDRTMWIQLMASKSLWIFNQRDFIRILDMVEKLHHYQADCMWECLYSSFALGNLPSHSELIWMIETIMLTIHCLIVIIWFIIIVIIIIHRGDIYEEGEDKGKPEEERVYKSLCWWARITPS